MVIAHQSGEALLDEIFHGQPGGGVEQRQAPGGVGKTPPPVRENQLRGTAAGYKAQAKADGIPLR